ncbi:protein NLRC3-like [Odontesthes bonariensis]|uniref:protein NLRC3-like n=1 Tax=Odontesthes bonariensis TaxID=219752 RepID=UPI003F58D756
MNVSEETEDSASTSEAALSVQHDKQIGIKGKAVWEIPDSPEPRSVSMRSDQSKHEPFDFKGGGHSGQQMPLSTTSKEFKAGQSPDEQSFAPTSVHIGQKRTESPRDPHDQSTHLDSIFMELEEDMIWAEQGSSTRVPFPKIPMNFLRRQKEEQMDDSLRSKTFIASCQHKLKSNLKRKFQCLNEGMSQARRPTFLNQIYTELHITDVGRGEVNEQHEFRQIEAASRRPTGSETTISCADIFKPVAGRDKPARTVVTKGVAGIGKTVLTQKFTLDWAEEKANHNIQFIFPFTFRELNLLKAHNYSLVELIHHFFSEIKEAGICSFEEFQVVFILDGLDECRPPLDFHNTQILKNGTESTSVHALLTNLIRGNLFPSARLWITTRPAAANQIPPDCVDVVTEVRGFTDPQKEEYFKKRFRDEEQASKISSHIGTSRSLHIMCHIPAFCWITGSVLDHLLKTEEKSKLPKTLTAMYTHFLVVQANQDNVKYDRKVETDPVWSTETKKIVVALGRLAFEQLEEGNLIFYEEDLKEYDIDIEAICSGVLTEIFNEERGLTHERVFGFVHLSVQEFLAALYVSLTFMNTGVNLLRKRSSSLCQESKLKYFYRSAVDKALESENGHLDMFVRFLLGLSLNANQTLLGGLMQRSRDKPQVKKMLVLYIREKIRESPSTERSIRLFYWLNELNDHSLEEEIQCYLKPEGASEKKLTPSQWSALVFILLSSQKDLEVFDLKKFSASKEALVHLLPVVEVSKTSLLSSCNLSCRSCASLLPTLTSENSRLRGLDLSNNDLHDTGVKTLSDGLKSPHCRLEVLSLSGCLIKEEGCAYLASALTSNPSHLRELDLSFNHPGESGLKLLSAGLQDPNWKLETLKTDHCGQLRLNPSPLRYFRELTLDPNTADRNLLLSESRKHVLVVKEKQPYPDHPERFDSWKQLLCGEHLTGRCYWDVEWKGRVRIGVAYRGIRRRGDSDDCCIGWNDQSWSLFCSPEGFTAWHNNKASDIQQRPDYSESNRVAVYLDWSAGTVSFYYLPSVVSSVKKIHLHTFRSTFTEPLYAAFSFGRTLELQNESRYLASSVILSKIEE